MKLIAHRGLTEFDPKLQGIVVYEENSPPQIYSAIKAGFDVEIDLRYDEGKMYLGHDVARCEIQDYTLVEWAKKCTVYAHCKDIKAAFHCPGLDTIIPFCHAEDDFIMLKNHLLWVHPKFINNIPPTVRPQCIIVMPPTMDFPPFSDYYGVCTGNPSGMAYKLKMGW
jgi:hypothetical protein